MQRVARPLVGVALLVAAACGGDANGQQVSTSEVDSVNRSSQSDSSDADLADAATDDQAESAAYLDAADLYRSVADASIELELLMTAETVVDLVVHPVDGALHVVEHAGRILRVNNDAGDDVDVVVDFAERLVGHRDEQGLTGFEFAADGRFAWLHYTLPDGTTTVSEVAVGDDGMIDMASERVLFALGEVDDDVDVVT